MLIRMLMDIQREFGHLPKAELASLADTLGIPKARVWDVASYFPHFRLAPGPKVTIGVCGDLACHLRGAADILKSLSATEKPGEVEVKSVSCLGRCDSAPVVRIAWNGPGMAHPRYLGGDSLGAMPDEWIDAIGEPVRQGPALATRSVRVGKPARWEIDIYDARNAKGGEDTPGPFDALKKQLGRQPRELIEELKQSGLVGLGGALGRTGKKWEDVFKERTTPKYVVANGDESEPGTFKDRELLIRNPDLVVEGVALAALVLGAERGFIYIRHEYEEQGEAVERAIVRATKAVPEAFQSFRMETFISPGGYICGEQSALLEVIEGRRAQPRDPFPSLQTNGLRDCPTLVNNVETFARVPGIVLRGADWYASCRRRLFSICGDVEQPGVHEVAFETTLSALIGLSGGTRGGREFKAVAPAGPSGGFLPRYLAAEPLRRAIEANLPGIRERAAAELQGGKKTLDRSSPGTIGADRPNLSERIFADVARIEQFLAESRGAERIDLGALPLDGAIWKAMGLMLGPGIFIYGDGTSMMDQAINGLEFFRKESCGKCAPCRLGTQKLVRIAGILQGSAVEPIDQHLIDQGVDRAAVREAVAELAGAMDGASICGLGRVAANPLTSVLEYFADEIERPAGLGGTRQDHAPEAAR